MARFYNSFLNETGKLQSSSGCFCTELLARTLRNQIAVDSSNKDHKVLLDLLEEKIFGVWEFFNRQGSSPAGVLC